MDCYYSKMRTFHHFLFLNHRRKFGDSSFCRTLGFLYSSKASNRDIYSLGYGLQTSRHNTNNDRGTGFRRAWIHTSGRRLMLNANNGSGDDRFMHPYTKRKAGKCKTVFVCGDCGDSFGQWWGVCPSCKKSGVLKRYRIEESAPGGSLGGGAGNRAAELGLSGFKPENCVREPEAREGWVHRPVSSSSQPQRLSDVTQGLDVEKWRIQLTGTFGMEVGRVLGGGLVPGSLILIAGDPGVGKSTLLLQISDNLSKGCNVNESASVLYISGEESVEQIASRASRMQIRTAEILLYSCTNLEEIIPKIHNIRPRAVIVDSIQTVYLKEASGTAGNVTQVKECAIGLLRCAKETGATIFLVGHVTKSGDIAGPRVLEHIVDVVLYLEGDRLLSHRILRAVKNRFGSSDEIGVLEMGENGLQVITNPSELYISERNINQVASVGLALTVIIDGSRPFLIETQALCTPRGSPGTSRMTRFNGVDDKRADMIIAVLGKQAGVDRPGSFIFLNVVGGVRVEETAADLAIAASICSSFLDVPVPITMAFIGEIGLGGELRTVPRMDKRINELAKLGFTKCVIPASSMKSLKGHEWEGMSIIYCQSLKEVIQIVFSGNRNPIPTLLEVKLEDEGEQKDVNGVASEKQGWGGQKDMSMGVAEKKDTSSAMGDGVHEQMGGDRVFVEQKGMVGNQFHPPHAHRRRDSRNNGAGKNTSYRSPYGGDSYRSPYGGDPRGDWQNNLGRQQRGEFRGHNRS